MRQRDAGILRLGLIVEAHYASPPEGKERLGCRGSGGGIAGSRVSLERDVEATRHVFRQYLGVGGRRVVVETDSSEATDAGAHEDLRLFGR